MRVTGAVKLVLLLLGLAVAGCATVRTVDTGSASSMRAELEVGNQLTLTTNDERQYEITVVSLSDVAIEGEDEDGESITIPYEDVLLLEVREPRPGRTAAAIGGGAVGLYAFFYGLALAALLGGFN